MTFAEWIREQKDICDKLKEQNYHQFSLFRYKKVLKPNITRNGYATVELFKEKESKRLLIHRLVALAFIPNTDNKEQVNHIDENKLNNAAENLEWCTPQENMNYGTRLSRQLRSVDYSSESRKRIARENGKAASKPVEQLDMNGNSIGKFKSIVEAQNYLGVDSSHIAECCKGQRKSSNGFVWRYEGRNDLSEFQY